MPDSKDARAGPATRKDTETTTKEREHLQSDLPPKNLGQVAKGDPEGTPEE